MKSPSKEALSTPGKWRHWSYTNNDYGSDCYDHEVAIKTCSLYMCEHFSAGPYPIYYSYDFQGKWNAYGMYIDYSTTAPYYVGRDNGPEWRRWQLSFSLSPAIKRTIRIDLGAIEEECRHAFIQLLSELHHDVASIIYEYASELADVVAFCKR